MTNEELEIIKQDATRFVDELKDKVHEQHEEIQQLKEELTKEKQAFINMYNQYVEKDNIIKEVREILLNYGETFDLKVHQEMQKKLLEILDKENKQIYGDKLKVEWFEESILDKVDKENI